MTLITERLHALRGEELKVFAAIADEVRKHLTNPRLRKFIDREVKATLKLGALA